MYVLVMLHIHNTLTTVQQKIPVCSAIIKNQSNIPATVREVTFNYQLQGDAKSKKTLSSATTLHLKSYEQKSILLSILLPEGQVKKHKSVVSMGISQIKVSKKTSKTVDTISITPPWTAASKEDAICIDHDGTQWKLTPCNKKSKSTTKNKKNKKITSQDSIDAVMTAALHKQNTSTNNKKAHKKSTQKNKVASNKTNTPQPNKPASVAQKP